MEIPTRYYLDNDTLTYKPVDRSLRSWIKGNYKCVGAVLLFSIIISLGLVFYNVTPSILILSKENQKLASTISESNSSVEGLRNILSLIQENDDVIYRPFVDIQPIPKSVREAGFGGIDRYRQFAGIENSDGVITAYKNIDKLLGQIEVQKNSFQDIEQVVSYIDDFHACKPAIRPMLRKYSHYITSGFGMRFHPVHKRSILHSGIDFGVNMGTPVYATGSGVIKEAKHSRGYGNVVYVNHGYGYQSIYAHLSRYIVTKGDTVTRGQLIAFSGNSGISTGPHLHYEIRKNNRPVNPSYYYIDDLKDEEYVQMVKK